MKDTITAALRAAGHNVVLQPDYTFAVPAGVHISELDGALAALDGVRIVRNGQVCSVAVELRVAVRELQLITVGGE